MAEAKAADKPPEKKKDAAKGKKGDKKAVGGLRSYAPKFSAAGCAAWLTALFLAILVVGVWMAFWLAPGNVPWRHSMGWWRIAVEVLLVIAIPLVLYQAVRLWLEGEPSAFPDLDFAWRTGLEALAQNGLSLNSAPLFLIVGSSGVRQESALLRAAGLALRVHDLPEGPAPLHWYAGPEGIYLVVSEACSLSSLAALLEKRRASSSSSGDMGSASDIGSLPALAAAVSAPASVPRAAAAPSGGSRGTIMLDSFVAAQQAAAQQVAVAQAAQASADADDDREPTSIARGSDQPAILAPQEVARQLARLEYVCQLIRQARFPLCSINGVLVLLPFEMLQATQRETEQLEKSVRSDLACLQRELSIRCPVTALVMGMHQERGFRELVRRVGRERATAQRFGRRFDLRIIPSADGLAALCALTAGVFEDWIHTLFREAEALSRPGNLRLYGLLCKMRSTLSSVLTDVLIGGFAHDVNSKDALEPIPFSGCYFAATGDSDDQQAFVRGVFEKLIEEQEDVEWTRKATLQNRGWRTLAAAAAALAGVCLIGIVTLTIWRLVT